MICTQLIWVVINKDTTKIYFWVLKPPHESFFWKCGETYFYGTGWEMGIWFGPKNPSRFIGRWNSCNRHLLLYIMLSSGNCSSRALYVRRYHIFHYSTLNASHQEACIKRHWGLFLTLDIL